MLDKGAVLRDALLGQPSIRAYLNETGLLQHPAPLSPLTCSSELHYDGSASDKGDSTTEVDIGRGQIVKALVVAAGVVVVDELG